MTVDDYGRFHADPVMIKSLCFPRLDKITVTQVEKWLSALGEIVVFYTHKGEKYLEIYNFNQTVRLKKEKFPKPSESDILEFESRCTADAQQMQESCAPETKRNESETNPKLESESKSRKREPQRDILFRDSEYFDIELLEKKLFDCGPPYSIALVKHYFDAALNWSDAGGKKKKDWLATIRGFIKRDEDEGKLKIKLSGLNIIPIIPKTPMDRAKQKLAEADRLEALQKQSKNDEQRKIS